MVPTTLIILILVFFATSVISVVTGSTSLITIPVMISFGIEPHIAIATNMLALTLMSIGGFAPFVGKRLISRSRLPVSIALTVAGSGIGALVLLVMPVRGLHYTVGIAMLVVAGFTLFNKNLGTAIQDAPVSHASEFAGYAATFLLAIYGGFFSGGYITLLTATFVTLFGMTFLQAVATTKVINVFSSAVATMVFLWRGVVDVGPGLILGGTMFLGAIIGARIALRLSAVWLRRIFVAAVLCLAVRMLFPI